MSQRGDEERAFRYRPAAAPAISRWKAPQRGCSCRLAVKCWSASANAGATREAWEATMTFKALGFAGIAAVVAANPAFAHHSFAMFDAETILTLVGTVKEFQWTNPHAWIL